MDEHGQRESIFEGYVPNIADREQFWKRIKESRAADQRNCCMFKDKEEYVIFLYTIQ